MVKQAPKQVSSGLRQEKTLAPKRKSESTDARHRCGVTRRSDEVHESGQSKGVTLSGFTERSTEEDEPLSETKPFDISKEIVEEAFECVRASKGAAGVDGQTIEDFEKNLEKNLYKIWNRMSSGTYFPPAVRGVEIPKDHGKGVRLLGVPTVADRVAQTVVKMYLEPLVEPKFHPDSYGYRPGKSQHQALTEARKRCWKYDWVLDLDISKFFDNLDHELVMDAVKKHTNCKWMLLYIERWLKAPMQMKDGTLVARDRGSPQGSAISPLISNIFMHHVFDEWMQTKFAYIPFERYADDVLAHCVSESQAKYVREAIMKRLALYKLELHPEKTRIVYCKDGNRKGSSEHERFDYLGFTFRPRMSKNKSGQYFVSFSPATSDNAAKKIRETIRKWRLHLRSDKSLNDLAHVSNDVVRGWINYYGYFYKSALIPSLKQLNEYLVRWAMRKYKKLKRHPTRARSWLAQIAQREPNLFAHWKFGLLPLAG